MRHVLVWTVRGEYGGAGEGGDHGLSDGEERVRKGPRVDERDWEGDGVVVCGVVSWLGVAWGVHLVNLMCSSGDT